MHDQLRLGIVGCGGISRAHVTGFEELYRGGCREVVITACCDLNEGAARERAEELSAIQGTRPEVFTDLEGLLDAGSIDAADICLPHWLHHSAALKLIDAGLHVMVEKPLGITIRAARKIIDAAEEEGVVLATAENIRRYPTSRAFRWAVSEEKLAGDIFEADIFTARDSLLPLEEPHFKWRGVRVLTGGGMILDSGAHFADMMVHLFGDVDRVFCTTSVRDERMIEGAPVVGEAIKNVEDNWSAQIRFKSGVEVSWRNTVFHYGEEIEFGNYYGDRGTVINSRGTIHPFQLGGRIEFKDGRSLDNDEVIRRYLGSLDRLEKEKLFPHGCEDGFGVQIGDFARAIREGGEPEIDGEGGLRAQALCFSCYESATLGQPVSYDDVLGGGVEEYQAEINEYWDI